MGVHVVHMGSNRYSNVYAGVRTNPDPLLKPTYP